MARKLFAALILVFVIAAYGAVFDNLKISGNTISSLNTNGDIVLDPNGTGEVTLPDLTTSRALIINGNSELVNSTVTETELGYVSGVTSSIQTQLNNKTFDNLSPMTSSGDIIYGGALGAAQRLGVGTNGQVLKLVAGIPAWQNEASVAAQPSTPAHINIAFVDDQNWDAESGDTTDFAETGGGTLASEGTTVFQGNFSVSYDASAASDTMTFGPVDISPLDGNRCIASFWYSGFDSNITAQVWDGSTVLNSVVLSAQTGWVRQEQGMYFDCDDSSTSDIYIRLLAGGDAAIGYVDNIWIGENYRGQDWETESAQIGTCGTGTTVSRESSDWLGTPVNNAVGDCTVPINAGIFSATPNCTLGLGSSGAANVPRITSISTSSIRIAIVNLASAAVSDNVMLICNGPR